MDQASRIAAYLAREALEDFRDRTTYELDPVSRFLYVRAKEFYWTLTRLAGLAHLHDGAYRRPARRAEPRAPLADFAAPMKRPRVLVDMTATHRYGLETGIQRVVREIARWAVASGAGLPVVIEERRLVSYYSHAALPPQVEIAPGDKFLMFDASFHDIDEYAPIMRRVSAEGGQNVLGLYDLIPLLYPGAISPGLYLDFRRWFDTMVPSCDAIVCISQSTAQSLVGYLRAHSYPADALRRVGWWRLGADFAATEAAPGRKAASIAATRAPLFLSVGTLEPRKAYPIALEAFERLWRSGVDARYVIVGRVGWQGRLLARRIRDHEEYGRRLFWLDDADDASLRHLYAQAHGLVSASIAEGFGLPLAEAAFHGLPVIASDIPAHREIAEQGATFFPPLDAAALSMRLREALMRHWSTQNHEARIVTWRESTQELLGMIRADSYQWRFERGGFRADARICV
ncbi:glycosyltransferase family 1 protein [Methylosinus sp. PW1]|uniref:glycosyltransferase family 4 protein n=1 Tax=Methylosinus sp. PW1 TaxID=107636 RepID=UPI000689CE45|nr:glycosyltransferase family 1 protein [Methylosinus sp. PW1]